ncbi:MAG TPA: 23S rRNA (adenine(2503)-C(2))-methyltransferase RlmN [Verrucomicrobiales bacterium]|nr:23S rRNA (adenine(2503)-C(2))-methyltransferase RlmN [Verrucomicrobiales bacterium]
METAAVSPAAAAPALTGMLPEELAEELASWGEPKYRASQILDWVFQKRAAAYEAMTSLSKSLRAKLAETHPLHTMRIAKVQGAKDTTQKFLFKLHDGRYVESVLIPANRSAFGEQSDRRTICVSSQVGCAYDCKFCASGLAGFTRNLRADEIVEQILQVEAHSGERIDNIVFMGMGEPLANFTNLSRAIRIIQADWGIGIGARHITVSTSGLAPQIKKLADFPMPVRLAISFHGATDEVRSIIMPVNRKYPIDTLFEALTYFRDRKKQKITLEYILIENINDQPEHAAALARRARSIQAKVNLIPYNTVEGLPWTRPSEPAQDAFLAVLENAGVPATIRREKGHDIDAACGQLRLKQEMSER